MVVGERWKVDESDVWVMRDSWWDESDAWDRWDSSHQQLTNNLPLPLFTLHYQLSTTNYPLPTTPYQKFPS